MATRLDIKGANLLVNESGIVKLADFGLAKILMGNSYDLSLKGSPYWMAPEVVNGAIKNKSNPDVAMGIDIWSLGCTIIEMLTGKPPWSEREGPSAMFKVLQESPPIPETLSSVGKDFLQKCFQRDPADRPSSSALLKHAFVQNLHDQDVLGHPQSYPRGDFGQGVSANLFHEPCGSLICPRMQGAWVLGTLGAWVLRTLGARVFRKLASRLVGSLGYFEPREVLKLGKSGACPRDTTTNRSGIMQATMSSRCLNKIQKLVGDTSEQSRAKESNHIIAYSHSHVPEVNILQSALKPGTLNYMSVENSRNISTMMRMITNF
ncbi:unnamed protein product [Sphenostylis stenocarpa]|uniref:Protein kinase domain-containing protein n=1 Tax=Sphenostylis stenocarpa TaxID=92480 RepID=A0AA86T1L4_9FABA|nr:unnamed protein product [Sphenostylis stenocarpa]